MDMFRRAMIDGQPVDIATRYRRDAANLARCTTDMIEALARKRGQGTSQTVRVERVVVEQGAQAVVGNVRQGGGSRG